MCNLLCLFSDFALSATLMCCSCYFLKSEQDSVLDTVVGSYWSTPAGVLEFSMVEAMISERRNVVVSYNILFVDISVVSE